MARWWRYGRARCPKCNMWVIAPSWKEHEKRCHGKG